ncbi:hypothetical protein N7532_000904 [Penicillium argentinense]|uniref:Uncharacterized protein n=1 Tax=Penicillium argentinense TaxID=1131581 RepID=A0A9W9KN21_9EURO|nr:hypothetical protein N7532_000904 [Penicillium argentinense]
MTTGRINQITRSSGTCRGPRAAEADPGPRQGPPPEGGLECRYHGRGARGARPARHPRRTGGDAGGHPIAPTKPLSAGPHAGVPARSPWRAGGWLRHTALGWRVRTPWTTPADGGSHGAAPPGILVSGVASGHPSTDSSGAGDQAAPGLQALQRPPAPQLYASWALAGGAGRGCGRRSLTGAGAGQNATLTPDPERGSFRQGRSQPQPPGARRLTDTHAGQKCDTHIRSGEQARREEGVGAETEGQKGKKENKLFFSSHLFCSSHLPHLPAAHAGRRPVAAAAGPVVPRVVTPATPERPGLAGAARGRPPFALARAPPLAGHRLASHRGPCALSGSTQVPTFDWSAEPPRQVDQQPNEAGHGRSLDGKKEKYTSSRGRSRPRGESGTDAGTQLPTYRSSDRAHVPSPRRQLANIPLQAPGAAGALDGEVVPRASPSNPPTLQPPTPPTRPAQVPAANWRTPPGGGRGALGRVGASPEAPDRGSPRLPRPGAPGFPPRPSRGRRVAPVATPPPESPQWAVNLWAMHPTWIPLGSHLDWTKMKTIFHRAIPVRGDLVVCEGTTLPRQQGARAVAWGLLGTVGLGCVAQTHLSHARLWVGGEVGPPTCRAGLIALRLLSTDSPPTPAGRGRPLRPGRPAHATSPGVPPGAWARGVRTPDPSRWQHRRGGQSARGAIHYTACGRALASGRTGDPLPQAGGTSQVPPEQLAWAGPATGVRGPPDLARQLADPGLARGHPRPPPGVVRPQVSLLTHLRRLAFPQSNLGV